ncbi:GlxA family transcriptional regulator [Pseudomonas argentinensis]|uniref:Transcriptional regulator, AraC family with amidase-like domain n=1 Tax=Phytopseudomonas argentinensis TaxID=289370 RepID=A0A1I3JUF4_9GAMM|nr:GlxA family transcriptional regulator [Pseudomonas argentinensis]KAB0550992.1 GlxA family transcriptional regulator [Pseudomonas argentinensis]SFI63897.1 transcriptional regulator, AraC family with amidase-like domain [Pseudomonas argentinensis]
MADRRSFSETLQGQNLRFVAAKKDASRQTRVGFLLQEHFSLPAFTQALDVLVTANLIDRGLFATRTFSLDGAAVTSDLGIVICPDAELTGKDLAELDLLVICAGLRTPLRPTPVLRQLLRNAADKQVALAGLWSGAWFIGQAGLLDGYRCAIHPEHRAALAEIARHSQVTAESFVVDRDRLTAASPTGAFHMVLEWIGTLHGHDLAEGIVGILAFEESRYKRVKPTLHAKMSEPLRTVINLMSANIEEPLSTDQLAAYSGRSRRQIERLFQQQLGTTPARYYLELRITEGRRLLQHSDLPVLDVSVACGFVSPSHFSKCYTAYFGNSPSREVRHGNVKSSQRRGE